MRCLTRARHLRIAAAGILKLCHDWRHGRLGIKQYLVIKSRSVNESYTKNHLTLASARVMLQKASHHDASASETSW